MVLEQVELEIAASNQLPCRPEDLIKYIAKEVLPNKRRSTASTSPSKTPPSLRPSSRGC